MTSDAPVVPLSRRERYRQQTCGEIKDAAKRQIADSGGAGTLSLNALARSLGMAGPSLYRYFESRDALLTALLVDAYSDLAASSAAAVDTGTPAADQLRAYAAAYRRWALDHPELYELLFGTPVPGYTAPPDATGPVAARALQTLVALLGRVRSAAGATAAAPAGLRPTDRWSALLAEVPGADPAAFVSAVRAWTRLHGAISLELRGHTPHVLADPDALYAAEVEDVIRAA